jgi:glutathione S-transferase
VYTQVPAIWYDAPKDADVTKPPPGTFVLPESGLIVDFVTSLYPQIAPSDPLEKARAAYVNAQFEALVSPKMYALASSDGDKNGTAYKEFLEGVKKFLQYLPDSYVDDKEFNNADILIAPFIVSLVRSLDVMDWD